MYTTTILSSLILLGNAVAIDCRPPGPVVPKPRNLHANELFAQATANLTGALESALNGAIVAGWPVENTSFSIGLVSWDQPEKAVPTWEYHHLAPTNVNGTKHLTRDSQYLIGSISKVFTDYILLQSGLELDSPITEYLSVLQDEANLIHWRNITLRHLASQVAGIPPNYGFSEYYYLKEYFVALGFPLLPDSDYPPCGVLELNGGCTKDQFFQGMLSSYPVAAPESRPVYSNIAFNLIVYAIQEQTGQNYTELLRDFVTTPLGLSNTMVSPGDDSKAVIPPVDNSWGSDYGDNAPGGGLVSSLSDLSIFIRGILDHSILESETEVLQWLKPSSSTGSPSSLVGMPWEIYRTQELTPAHPHTIDIYAKAGSAYGYQSHMAVIDEYGVAVVVLTAGSAKATDIIYGTVLSTLIPAIDEIARSQAAQYTGSFVSVADGGVNATLVQDDDSLVLAGLRRNGTDVLEGLFEINRVAIGGFLNVEPSRARLYPVGVEAPGSRPRPDGSNGTVVLQDWRVDWVFEMRSDSELPGAALTAGDCLTWTLADWIHYGSEPLDRVVFVLDPQTRQVLGVEVPFIRSGVLGKSESGD
ncbi:uncharacterized protein JN550_000083 [Neoarthrinium moseri]|uniref:uncharacterized protein n=1 Tax=Neoarthrinium moseri TaxID=1658444 RepID=UPI001FDE8DBB|nr:uncharacterized protein JN550_000083 [Neoarthrinium moseri]KAI1877901.1 hypothetical protein JN550_000083 [Neoarthrinium moseri]